MQVKPEFQQMSRQDIENHLITKATTDPAFRASLLSDPRGALAQEIGLEVPADFKLNIIEETSNSMTLVLPQTAGELSEMELEAVAGGKGSSRGPAQKVPTGRIGGGGRLIGNDGQG